MSQTMPPAPDEIQNPADCPHCGADLTGAPIPVESRHYYGSATHFDRRIGVEVRGVYDGVLFWRCPDCGGPWHRWPAGNTLRERAADHMSWPVRGDGAR